MKYNKNRYFNNISTIILSLFLCFLLQNCSKKHNTEKQLLKEIQKELDLTNKEDKEFNDVIDSLLLQKDNSDISKYITRYGKELHYTGQQTKAIEFYNLIVGYYQSLQKPTKEQYKHLIECYIPLGAAFEELGLKNTAMNYYMKGIKIAEEQNLQTQRAMLLNNIGVIYFGFNNYDQSLNYFTQASVINLKHQNNQELFINYNNIAEIYLKKNNLEKAMDYSLKALQYLNEQTDQEMYYMMHANIGAIYTLRHEYPMALSYLNNAITHQKQLGLTTYLITSYLNTAELYSKINALDSANYFARQAEELAKETQNILLQSQAIQTQARLAKIEKNYIQGFNLLEKNNILKDSILRLDNQRKMEDWEKIYELEKKYYQNNSIIAQWNPKTIFYIMILIVTILICIIVILYLINKSKDKTLKSKELHEIRQNKEQSKRIAAEEEKSKEMQKEIDRRNRELTTYTLEKMRFNEQITDINTELKKVLLEINPRSKEHKERLQNLLNKLLLLENNTNWEEFQYYFEQVHPQFYEKLGTAYPTLTPKEKRLCAFISLGLSTKEIASITFREVRSCESSRNRLRKKLGVEPDIDLTNFIRQITN